MALRESSASIPVWGLLSAKAFVDASSPPKTAVTFIHKCGGQDGGKCRAFKRSHKSFLLTSIAGR